MSQKNNFLISYSLSHRFAWYRVAKVATRSIHSLLGDNVFDYIYLNKPGEMPDDLAAILHSDCFRFAFVRNPWDRLVSAWNNKIRRNVKHRLGYLKRLYTPIGSPLVSNLSGQSVEDIMEFGAFLKLLPDSTLFHQDRHFRPQAEILVNTDLHFTGRFDHFSGDFKYVLNYIGLPHLQDEIPHRNQSKFHCHYRELFFNPNDRQLVADLYLKDINRWGFEF